ncbi:YceI family protein [Hymenobacter sp. BT730]|uniref:YceI family protein n=1 Tax=Hymenobacter sp. BT730 TaxID=3063332 RepID=UPI0026DFAD7B|nr:YceI family protein [Hymenobacter sp. BT730]
MMKLLRLIFLALLLHTAAFGQSRYMTHSGRISFYSAAPLEDIEAKSEKAGGIIDLGTGQLAFNVPMKSFVFPNGLMQEHFNENYVESDRYPKSTFVGKVLGLNTNALQAGGPQPVQAEGDLTIHGVTHRVRVPGTLELRSNGLQLNAKFNVAPADYNIVIPRLVRDHIAKSVGVTVNMLCPPVPQP